MAKQDLIEWVNARMKERGWGVLKLARASGVSHPRISYLLQGDKPSFDTCIALSKAFDVPETEVLILAGHADVKTTRRYNHLAAIMRRNRISPMDATRNKTEKRNAL